MDEQKIIQTLSDYGFTPDAFVEYDIKILDVKPLFSVLQLKTAAGDFVLKKFKFTAEELNYSLAAMRHVKRKGFLYQTSFLLVKEKCLSK
ncbi:hypothetical protein ACI2OX_06565 [Bacillus sp. N9]